MDIIDNFYVENTTLVKYNGTESSVIIPNYIKTIGKGAFEENRFLTTVIMGNGVEKIEDNAFAYCRSLSKIALSSNLTVLGKGSFAWCKNLKKIFIPISVAKIGDGAFEQLLVQEGEDKLLILCEVRKPLFRLPCGWSKRWLGENGKRNIKVVWDCMI